MVVIGIACFINVEEQRVIVRSLILALFVLVAPIPLVPTGGYLHASTALLASSAFLTSGTTIPSAPESITLLIINGSLPATLTNTGISECSTALKQ